MQFRVAQTPGAAHVQKEFGYQSGMLTPEIVHEAARQAKILDLQKQLRTAYNRHDAKIRANKVEIERLTLEAIDSGLKDGIQIQKYVNDAIKAAAKYDSKIATLAHQLQNELDLVTVEGLSTTTLANMDFRQRLLLIKADHQAKGEIRTNGFQQSLRLIQASPQQAIAMQGRKAALNNYINAKDFDAVPAVPGGNSGLSISGNGNGFFGGLFNFFSGRK